MIDFFLMCFLLHFFDNLQQGLLLLLAQVLSGNQRGNHELRRAVKDAVDKAFHFLFAAGFLANRRTVAEITRVALVGFNRFFLHKPSDHRSDGRVTPARICDCFGVTFVESEPPKPAQLEQPAEQKLYRVQVGAFASRANAEKMVQRLKAAGFDAFIRQDV